MSKWRIRFNTTDPALLAKGEKLRPFIDSLMPDVRRVSQHALFERLAFGRCWVCEGPLTPHGGDECPHTDAEIGQATRIVLGTEPH